MDTTVTDLFEIPLVLDSASKDSRTSTSQLCERCQNHASDLWEFFNTLVPRERYDLPRRTCTLNLGLISHKEPDTCHLCAIIVDLRKNVEIHHDQTPTGEEEVDLSNVNTLSEHCFEIIFRSVDAETLWKFKYLRLCAYKLSDILPQDQVSNTSARMRRLKDWIRDCSLLHKSCRENRGLEAFPLWDDPGHTRSTEALDLRPKRVLEVGAEGVLVLRESGSIPQPYEYVTLSHMWGEHPDEQLRLSQSRLSEFERAVPWHELSDIYRKAVTMTVRLGYRFLWIDSLCIIQDSPSDWQLEASRMADVYSNAVCNLSFLYPPEGHDSATIDRRSKLPCILQPPDTRRLGLLLQVCGDQYVDVAVPYYSADVATFDDYNPALQNYWAWLQRSDWPLFTRAWVLQEYLLCQRTILVFSDGHLAWECPESFVDELAGTFSCQTSSGSSKSYYTKQFSARSLESSSSEVLHSWLKLVENYQRRRLTKEADRIIAFSGIARAFSGRYKLTYVAGLFVEHMPAALCWFYESEHNDGNTKLRQDCASLAPSWSWLSRSASSRHSLSSWIDLETYQGLQRVATTSFSWNNQATHPSKDAHHDFSGLQMTLKAPAFAAISLDLHTGVLLIQPPALLSPHNNLQLHIEIRSSHLDSSNLSLQSSERRIFVVALRVRKLLGQLRADSLILKNQGKANTWERIGVCTVGLSCTSNGSGEVPVPPYFTMWLKQYEKEFTVV